MAMQRDRARQPGTGEPDPANAGGDAAGGAPVEVELKLACDAATLSAIADSRPIADHARNQGTVRRLESVYFDTADRRLSRRGAAFRVRRVGRRHIQTLKAEDTGNLGGLTRRGEWEWPVAGLAPDLSVVVEDGARSILGAMDAGDLAPLFATRIRRRAIMLDLDGATIELALDEGTVQAGADTAPIVETELELKAGRAETLYDLALRIAALAPVWLEPRSKAERGYALADGTPPAGVKRRLVPPPPDATVDQSLSVYLGECLSHLTRNVPAVVDGRDPEGVHQARVALRRLRSCLDVFRLPLPGDTRARLNQAAKTLAGALGPARDLSVFADTVLPAIAADVGAGPLAPLTSAAGAAGADAQRAARMAITGPEAARLALQVGHWIAARGWRDQPYSPDAALLDRPLRDLAVPVLNERYRRVIKKGRHFERLTMDQRHEVRLEAKKLRYALEFLAHLYKPKRVAPFDRALRRLQSALGRHQDNATARTLVAALAGQDTPALARAGGLAEGWLARDISSDEDRLVERWRAFAEARRFWHTGD